MIKSNENLFNLGVLHGSTNRGFGNMRELKNQETVFSALGLPPENFLRFKQVHGDEIVEVHTQKDFDDVKNNLPEADAWLFTRPQTGVVILTADCIPVFMWSADGKVLGLAHAGWRGVANGIAAKLVKRMKEITSGEISVFTGPHIQKCCFEVQDDVAKEFPRFTKVRGEKTYVDLNAALKAQLKKAGVKVPNMFFGCKCGGVCTCCNGQEYFSYRRTKKKDAIMSFMYKL